jgi:hypothetical protein
MAEHASSTLQIMRDELDIRRERRDADHAGAARLLADGRLALTRGRALVLVCGSPPTPVEVPSPRPPPEPAPEPVASRMSLGAWSGWPAAAGGNGGAG